MSSEINPIDHPICLAVPERQAASHWAEHVPFAMWLISALQPRVLVELGTFRGTSYCGFCQAIAALGLPTRAFAVDTWQGDPHNGFDGPEALADLRHHHDTRYGGFSTLLEVTFDKAVHRFADGEIDLLHIDGYHTYEAVRHDFETWRCKVGNRGVILFHDVVERIADFGVWRLWEELAAQDPSFTFVHEHGLGVLAVGRDLPKEVQALVGMRGEEAERVRMLFHQLGRRVRLQMELDKVCAEWELKDARLVELEGDHVRLENEAKELLARVKWYEQELAELRLSLEQELAELRLSLSWRLTQRLSALTRQLAPLGSRRRQALKVTARFAEVAVREGTFTAARKVARKVGEFYPVRNREREHVQSWTSDHRPVFLLVSHQGGGGTERHIRELAEALRSEGVRPVLVRPSGTGSVLWEERDDDWQVTWCRASPPEREPMKELLNLVSPAHAHIHHMMGMPLGLIDLLTDRGVSYDWTVHDYYAICPRGHLNRADGVYCGEPEVRACDRCLAHLGDYHGKPVPEPITSWRDRFARHLRGARRVFAPSEDVRCRLARYFPELPVTVRPHFEVLPVLGGPAASVRPGEKVRVAVIGTIVALKGSRQLLACAHDARGRGLPLEFVVFGQTDRDAAFAQPGNVRVTGSYREKEVYQRLSAEQCHLAFLPTQLPESFMYTLSIAMAAGLYTVCFDLGAQAERLRAWGWGRALPLEAGPEAVNLALLAAAEALAAGSAPPPPPPTATYPDLLACYYDFTVEERNRFRVPPHRQATSAVPAPNFVQRNAHARPH